LYRPAYGIRIASVEVNTTMKKMLIASVAVGVGVAALLLSAKRNKRKGTGEIGAAARDAYKTMNAGIGAVERNAMHSMG
jgi:hypothetical protein